MKEIKVYVDEEPRKIATQLVDLENEQFNCVMLLFDTDIKPVEVVIDPKLKDHDRELVRQVCEKIKEKLGFIINGQERIICDGSMTGDKTILAVLNQIQKEFEK